MRERDTTTFGSGNDRGILVRVRSVCPSHISGRLPRERVPGVNEVADPAGTAFARATRAEPLGGGRYRGTIDPGWSDPPVPTAA